MLVHGYSITGYILTALPSGAASGPSSASAGCMGMQVRSPGTAQGLARDTHTYYFRFTSGVF